MLDPDDEEILAYHFDAFERGRGGHPHLHVRHAQAIGPYTFHKAHLSTGMVTLQEFLRMAVTDLGVEPQRPDWPDRTGVLGVDDVEGNGADYS